MNLKVLLFAAYILLPSFLYAQTDQNINRSDNNGAKQGHWIKKYPEGGVMYDGYFKDNRPTGEFKRYYEDGTLKSILEYSADGTTADVSLYYPNGLPASKGRYTGQLKEGIWTFYSSSESGVIIRREEYLHGKKNGVSTDFYPDSTVAEKVNYVNDIKEGEWFKYYPDGNISIKSRYTNNLLNGDFEAYYDNGKPEMTGRYKDNLRDGTWVIYLKNGSVRFNVEYKMGVTDNRDIEIYQTNFADSLEQNKVKIEDPEKTGKIW